MVDFKILSKSHETVMCVLRPQVSTDPCGYYHPSFGDVALSLQIRRDLNMARYEHWPGTQGACDSSHERKSRWEASSAGLTISLYRG